MSCIDFSPVSPYHFAVTSSTRVSVQLTCALTHTVLRSLGVACMHAQARPMPPSRAALSTHWPTRPLQVLVYDSRTLAVRRTIGRFKDMAYSGTFRSDGKLVVAGGEDGVVQVFDANSRTLLRQLKAHKRPVHVARFAPDRQHVLSGGDDATVRLWDVTGGMQVARLDGHTDYVRGAAVNPAAQDLWITGG